MVDHMQRGAFWRIWKLRARQDEVRAMSFWSWKASVAGLAIVTATTYAVAQMSGMRGSTGETPSQHGMTGTHCAIPPP
jgi:uncharacterized membrane protein